VRDPETLRWIHGDGGNGNGNGIGSNPHAGTIHDDPRPYRHSQSRRWGTLQQTGREAARLWDVLGDALANGWKAAQRVQHQQQEQQHWHRQQQYLPQPDSLDEFGIPRLGTSGLLSSSRDGGEEGTMGHDYGDGGNGSDNNNDDGRRKDYVLLPRLSRNPTWGAAPNLDGALVESQRPLNIAVRVLF
jgi:hypothetical protein